MGFLKYNISTQTFTKSGRVNISTTCNGWSVINLGTSNVLVNQDTLIPGESKTVGGNYGEIYIGRVDLLFQGAGTNNAVFTEKYYMDGPVYDPVKNNAT
jgi:hypothetical protein